MVVKKEVLYGFFVVNFEYEFEEIVSNDYFGMFEIFLKCCVVSFPTTRVKENREVPEV